MHHDPDFTPGHCLMFEQRRGYRPDFYPPRIDQLFGAGFQKVVILSRRRAPAVIQRDGFFHLVKIVIAFSPIRSRREASLRKRPSKGDEQRRLEIATPTATDRNLTLNTRARFDRRETDRCADAQRYGGVPA
jgi:hypothetical protein